MFRSTPLGRQNPVDRVRQSMANIRLEGLPPHPKTAALIQAMAEGKLAPEAAIKEIRSWYGR